MSDMYDLHELDYITPYIRRADIVRHDTGYPTWLSNETENLLLYIVHGSFVHTVDGHTAELSEGMVRIIPPYANQVVGEVTSDYLEFYCVYFDLFDSDESRNTEHRANDRHLPEREMFFSKHHTLGRIDESRRDTFLSRLNFIVRNHQKNPPLSTNLMLKSYMMLILADFFIAPPLNKRVQRTGASRNVSEALRYANHNFANPSLSVTEIASYLGISTAHLSRIAKRELGQNLSEYITSVRIKKAKELFALDKRISDVAAECGFLSLQSFSRTFHRVVGISPREYTARIPDSSGQQSKKRREIR